MSSNLKVNTILPSTGSNVAIGTAGGTVTMVGNVDIDINSGISTFNDIHISDKIVHDGDTNTSIRFPSSDTITFETNGSERFRITNAASSFTNKLIIDDGSNGHLFLNNTSSENTIHSGTTGFGAYKNLVINAAQHIFKVSNTEKVRIDSNGYLIAKADIRLRRTASDNGALYFGDTNNNYIFGSDTDDVITFATAGNERLRIDSNGMLGIGGSPKTVNTLNTIEIGNSGLFGSQIAARTVEMGANCYYNSGWKYKHADKASLYYQYQGYHSFETAATGSADGAISFQSRLKIDNDGYVTKTNQPSFLVAPANDGQTANGNVTYTTVFHNTGTHYSTSTGRFTAPIAGYYNFGANYVGAAACTNVFVRFYINGAVNQRGQHYSGGGVGAFQASGSPYMSCDLSGTHTLLQAGDYVQLNLAATNATQGQHGYMRFYGYLVH